MNKHFQQLDINVAVRPATLAGGRGLPAAMDPTTAGFRIAKRTFDLVAVIAARSECSISIGSIRR